MRRRGYETKIGQKRRQVGVFHFLFKPVKVEKQLEKLTILFRGAQVIGKVFEIYLKFCSEILPTRRSRNGHEVSPETRIGYHLVFLFLQDP